MPQIDIQAILPWGWGLLGLILLAAYLGIYTYWCRSLPKVVRILISSLRGVFLLLVFLLLLDLRIKWSRPVLVSPRIGVFLDNSLSMSNHPSASATTIFSQVATVLDWTREHNYEPVFMTFGEKLTPQKDFRMEYIPEERLTNFDLLEEVWQTGNLQAGFLFTDGVATSGKDPSAIDGPANVPIYTVGVGDTTSGPDLSIIDLRYPLSLLAQEQNPIQITVRGFNAAGTRSTLYVFHEDELIHSARVTFNSPDDVQVFTASVVGRLDGPNFRVELAVMAAEANIDNNRREFQIDVLPGRRRVTVLTGGLSPNTGLISRWVHQTRNAQVEHLHFLESAWQGPQEWFWQTQQDLVILDNYPTTNLADDHLDRLLAKLRRDRSAVIVIEGPNNDNRDFVRMLSTLGLGVQKERTGGTVPQLRLRPVTTATRAGLAGDAVPIADPVDFPPAAVVHSLASPRLGRRSSFLMTESRRPVIGYTLARGRKIGVIFLPALAAIDLKLKLTGWRDFLPETFETLVEWALEPEGFTPYVIQPDRRQYHLGEKVLLRGLMRDRAGTNMLQPMLTVEVMGPESATMVTLAYNFETGEYGGEFWPGEPGRHRFRIFEGDAVGELPVNAGFMVQAGRVELESLTQNRYGLQRLAESTGGGYVELGTIETLLSRQAYTARTITREYQFNLWRIRGLWLGLIILLGLEWGLRRFVGLI